MKNVRLPRIFFQDFPGTGIFKKKIHDFSGGMGTLLDAWQYTDSHSSMK